MSYKIWIEKSIKKKECCKFISDPRDLQRCCCGASILQHVQLTNTSHVRSSSIGRIWDSNRHTTQTPTDAYGVVEFQGAGHGNKANYIRLSDTTEPESVLQLLHCCWDLELPNLVISIRGGLQNFQLQPKLKRVLCKGLSKAARTTGAWILTGGTNTGVTLHVGDALNNHSVKMRGRIVTIGIAPWGVLNNRESLIGKDTTKPYHSVSCPISRGFKLNSHHTHFLLVDNGTTDQYGCELMLRRRLEKYISQQRLGNRSNRRVPLVSLVVEGGASTIRNILNNVTSYPPIPVVVFDGTGRAADIIAFTHKYTREDGTMDKLLEDQLLETMKHTFQLKQEQVGKLYDELMLSMKKKELITLFCLSEEELDIDVAILTALLKAQKRSYIDQLSLCLTWNRADIAKAQIFVHGRDWPENVLENIMMEALVQDKVEFVKLLKDNGVNMQKFLTIARMEELYNMKPGQTTLLYQLIRDIRQVNYIQRYTLYDVGLAMESLMGGTYQSSFKERRFKALYQTSIKRGLSFNFITDSIHNNENMYKFTDTLSFPFNELFVWAVLMGRQTMALFMWERDEEAMAKALVACKLYRELAKTADVIDMEIGDQLRKYSEEFQLLSLELLDLCYRVDDDITIQLLTIQLDNWSKHTSLSLAAAGQHREFLAHPCCQRLMSDLWLGGMVTTKYINLRVILAVLCPLAILGVVSFKSKEELQLMPQTLEEHMHDQADSDTEDETGDDGLKSGSQNSFHQLQEDEEDGRRMQSFDAKVTQPLKADPSQSTSDLMTSYVPPRRKQLRLGKKLHEFYRAPMSKFWFHTICFIGFMVAYNYTVLLHLPSNFPAINELVVIAYVVTLGMEHVREILASDPTRLSLKLRVFYSSYWHLHEALAILFFLIGMGFRFAPGTKSAGRVIYCVVIIMWYLKVLEVLSVNIYLGPFVNMIGKMMRDMCYFIILLIVFLMGFGVVRQSVLDPHHEWSWILLREVFKEPYFMIYGEVYADKINPPCGNGTEAGPCPPGHWTVPIVMAVYLVVSIILLVSLLIAVFNNTFNAVNSIARQLWQFQRYHLTMNYEQKPFLAPPFIIFNHAYKLLMLAICRCKRKQSGNTDHGLKLFLPPEEVQKLRDFEEACLELYLREKDDQKQSCNDERLKTVAQRVEDNRLRLEEIVEKENHTKMNLRAFDRRLMRLEEIALDTNRSIWTIHQMLSHALASQSSSEPESSPETTRRGPTQRLRHLAFIQDREDTNRFPLEEGVTPDELARPVAAFHQGQNRFRSFSLDRTTPVQENKRIATAILKPSVSVSDHAGTSSESDKLKRPTVLEHLKDNHGMSREFLPMGAKPKKTSDSKLEALAKSKSPKKSRLSTFERYASMVEQQSPIKPTADPMPIKRQVGYGASTPTPKNPNMLDLRLSSRDSDSNLSIYSIGSMKNTHMGSMPRPTPYVSAPVYSTITDHIDLSSLQMSNYSTHMVSANHSAGCLTFDDNLTSFDGDPTFSPLSQTVTAKRTGSPLSESSSGGLQQAEHHCFEMMGDVTEDELEPVDATDYDDNNDENGTDTGISFTVKNEVNNHTNMGNSTAETAC